MSTEQIPIPPPPQIPDPPEAQPPGGDGHEYDRCEQCSAPVEHTQRYCVNCGTHRRHVADPAAKYMSRVSAHTGPAAAPSTALITRASGSGGIGLFGAVALALVPIAAVVGVAIGRSSNNHDGQLIRALQNQQAHVTTNYVSSAGTGASSSTASSSSSTPTKSKKAKKTSTSKAKQSSSGTNSTSNGTATKITGSKVTSSEQAQGSAEAKKVQNSTGKSYVNADNNLPSTVVIGGQ